ncbi:MAG: glycosyltransferase [Haloarculaceae archaeon]
MKVLSLVTTRDPFYDDQVRVLERNGVSVTTVTIPSNCPRSLSDYGRFAPTVLREALSSYDLVHANYGLTAPFALAQPRRPVVLILWGSDLLGEYSWVSERCARYCDAVVVMTREMARRLDVSAHVVPHGVDLDRFSPADQAGAQRAVGWDSERAHVLFPYSPSRDVKNYPRARRVVDRARSRVDERLELHVVDDADHDEMPRYMNAADVLLFTSEREGSPNVGKEALACNLPVVATDVGDVRRRLRDVESAAVSTDDDELVDALVATLRTDRRPDGRAAVRDVSLARMGERLLDVYESVLVGEPATASEPPLRAR